MYFDYEHCVLTILHSVLVCVSVCGGGKNYHAFIVIEVNWSIYHDINLGHIAQPYIDTSCKIFLFISFNLGLRAEERSLNQGFS